MSFLRTVSRVSKGATCAIAMTFLAVSSTDAQTVIIDDSFADGITSNAPDQLNWNVTSSLAALDLAQPPGPVDYASGDSGRNIHAIFPTQTLTTFGEVLTLTFDFTTPTTIAYDGGSNGTTGSGAISSNEDFKFGLFDTSGAIGITDVTTSLPVDFNGPIEASRGTPNPPLNSLAGFQGEVDNINASGTDLGIRTHNINSDLSNAFPSGRLFGTNDGFDFIAGGDDDIVSFASDSDYVGTLIVEFSDASLTSLDITVGMKAVDGSYDDSFTRSVPIADDPGVSVGVNTTSFDMFALGVTTGAFGGTVGPTVGSSTVGEANNGIDISNVTITFTSASAPVLLGDVNLSGTVDFLDITPFIGVLSGGTFQAEADCNESGGVDFLDITPFIGILSGSGS